MFVVIGNEDVHELWHFRIPMAFQGFQDRERDVCSNTIYGHSHDLNMKHILIGLRVFLKDY